MRPCPLRSSVLALAVAGVNAMRYISAGAERFCRRSAQHNLAKGFNRIARAPSTCSRDMGGGGGERCRPGASKLLLAAVRMWRTRAVNAMLRVEALAAMWELEGRAAKDNEMGAASATVGGGQRARGLGLGGECRRVGGMRERDEVLRQADDLQGTPARKGRRRHSQFFLATPPIM